MLVDVITEDGTQNNIKECATVDELWDHVVDTVTPITDEAGFGVTFEYTETGEQIIRFHLDY